MMTRGFTNQTNRRARLALRATIKRTPAIYLPLARLRNGATDGCDLVESASPEAVRRDTELVIEAAGSSGNTFAVVAFRMAQRRRVSLAHHLHAAAQIKRAVKRGIPTLVLMRNPRDVATSRVVRHPPITLEEALREWCDFYESIGDLPGVLLVDFNSITKDFGLAIDNLNRQFGTSFERFEHTEANVRRVFQILDEIYRRRGGADQKRMVARPAPERDAARAELVTRYLGAELTPLRRRAERNYDRLAAKVVG
jgi:hypothetical protein